MARQSLDAGGGKGAGAGAGAAEGLGDGAAELRRRAKLLALCEGAIAGVKHEVLEDMLGVPLSLQLTG